MTCSVTEEEFQPVWWLDITVGRFLEEVARGASVVEAIQSFEPLIFGCFYQSGDNGKLLAFSGNAWWYKSQENRYIIPPSPLGSAKMNHPDHYWGKCSSEIEEILAENRRAQKLAEERQKRVKDLMASVLIRNGRHIGRGCVPVRKKD